MPLQYDHAPLQKRMLSQWSVRGALRSLWHVMLPCLFIVILAVVLAAPLHIPGQSELQAGLILGTVWFWALYHPAAMPIGLLFVSGFCVELFVATPPGLLLLWMLVVYGTAHTVRFHFAKSGFFRYWGLYASTVLVGVLVEWFLLSLHAMTLLPPFGILFQWILSIGVYPLLHVAFAWGRRFSHSSRHP